MPSRGEASLGHLVSCPFMAQAQLQVQLSSLPQLTAKAVLNKYVQTISLPKTSSDVPARTKCLVAGWGRTDQADTTDKLYETNITIYSRWKCRWIYPELNDGMICAGSPCWLKDTSQVSANVRWVLVPLSGALMGAIIPQELAESPCRPQSCPESAAWRGTSWH